MTSSAASSSSSSGSGSGSADFLLVLFLVEAVAVPFLFLGVATSADSSFVCWPLVARPLRLMSVQGNVLANIALVWRIERIAVYVV